VTISENVLGDAHDQTTLTNTRIADHKPLEEIVEI
jgi:hypothetical protein